MSVRGSGSQVSQWSGSQVSPWSGSQVSPLSGSQVSPWSGSQVSPLSGSQVSLWSFSHGLVPRSVCGLAPRGICTCMCEGIYIVQLGGGRIKGALDEIIVWIWQLGTTVYFCSIHLHVHVCILLGGRELGWREIVETSCLCDSSRLQGCSFCMYTVYIHCVCTKNLWHLLVIYSHGFHFKIS